MFYCKGTFLIWIIELNGFLKTVTLPYDLLWWSACCLILVVEYQDKDMALTSGHLRQNIVFYLKKSEMFPASAKILIYFENLSKYLTSSRYEFAVDFQAAIKLKLTIHHRGEVVQNNIPLQVANLNLTQSFFSKCWHVDAFLPYVEIC